MLQLRKFHTYDEWLKDRDPKKRPNHRTRVSFVAECYHVPHFN